MRADRARRVRVGSVAKETRAVSVVLMVAVLVGVAGCSTERPAAGPPVVPNDPLSFVVVGGPLARAAADRGGSDETWPQRLFRNVLPPGTSYVNLGRPSFRLAEAPELDPDLARIAPQLIIVWAGEDDIDAGVEPTRFGELYAALLDRLVATDRRVIVATLPGVEDAYNVAITADAAAVGATVVDLAGLIDPDEISGGKVSRSANQQVAAAFEPVLGT